MLAQSGLIAKISCSICY